MDNSQKIIVVAGPTSSGKSDFAVDLALQENGEILSADSRQIYRFLDIGTGKITKEETKGVPHYMIDVCDITDSFSVKQFRDMALPIIDDIVKRGKTPIICGGTGYYIDALIYTNSLPEGTVSPLPYNTDALTNDELWNKLFEKDKRRAETIDRHNRVRLIRALELVETHGKVPELPTPELRFKNIEFYLLNPKKEILEERVHKRLLKRFDQGMIEEMEELLKKGYSMETLSLRGIEYKWMAKYLQKEISHEELIKHLRIATWQYAKRQRTWNKKYEKFAKVIT